MIRTKRGIDGRSIPGLETDCRPPCQHLVELDDSFPASTLRAKSIDGVIRLYCVHCDYSRDPPLRFVSNPGSEPPIGWGG